MRGSPTRTTGAVSRSPEGKLRRRDPGKETEPMTDENGETIPETQPASEEVVPYDDGLGLPDTVAGAASPLGRRPLRLCRKRLRPQGQKTLRKARGKQSPGEEWR